MSFVHCIFVIVFCVIFVLGAIKSLCYVMVCVRMRVCSCMCA